jgi:tetratricopeptide (TPR) repeat protein
VTGPAAALLLTVLAGAEPSTPQGAYTEILAAYRQGDADAVARLGDVPETIVASELRRLQKLSRLPTRCRKCDETRVLDEYPMVPAAVLHTERAFQDDADGRRDTSERHLGYAREWLRLAGAEAEGVHRDWYLAVGTHLIDRVDLEEADRLLAEGTRTFPADPHLWSVSGMAVEMRGHLTTEADYVQSQSRRYLAEKMDARSEIRGSFLAAEKRYRQALVLDQALVETRIHLGKVLTALDRVDDAVAELEDAAARSSAPEDVYLTHLLAGRAEERRDRLDAAVGHHQKATAALPGAEAGWVALAHALDRAGRTGEATAAVARVVAADSPYVLDPFRAYHVGPRGGVAAALFRLKRWVK